MKAIVYRAFGDPDVLRLEDVERPEPGEHDLIVRNFATTVSAAETAARKGGALARMYFGLFRPKYPILGVTFAGVVVATGPAVTRFVVGDEVFGAVGPKFGALAEFVRISDASAITTKPQNLSFEQAVAVFDESLTALPFLRDYAALKPGQSVLVNGASGAVGTAAVQLAKHLGATVTAVCSARNHDLVTSLGADDVIDYQSTDFTASGKTFDVIFDAVGKSSYPKCKGSLTATGRYLTTVPGLPILARTLFLSKSKGKRGSVHFAGLRSTAAVAADLEYMSELAASGEYRPVIDRSYPLEQTPEAHRYVDTERKRGSVVVLIGEQP